MLNKYFQSMEKWISKCVDVGKGYGLAKKYRREKYWKSQSPYIIRQKLIKSKCPTRSIRQ